MRWVYTWDLGTWSAGCVGEGGSHLHGKRATGLTSLSPAYTRRRKRQARRKAGGQAREVTLLKAGRVRRAIHMPPPSRTMPSSISSLFITPDLSAKEEDE